MVTMGIQNTTTTFRSDLLSKFIDNSDIRQDQILFMCLHGSHLYGTDTPESDFDYKGVFIEDLNRIVLKKDRKTIQWSTGQSGSKNEPGDVDVTMIELRQFVKDALTGQPHAFDMLFCSNQCEITSSETWDGLKASVHRMLSKNIKPYIGYCRQQAAKYGLKGSRLHALEEVLALLRSHKRLSLVGDVKFNFGEFIKLFVAPGSAEEYIEVLGKKYNKCAKVESMLDSLEKLREKYGDRSDLAKRNEGIDWKAVSHAYRVMYQVSQLLVEKKITFPLRQAGKLKAIKTGMVPWERVNEQLPRIMSIVEALAQKSDLPDKPDKEFFDSFLLSCYKMKGWT